MPLTPEKYQKLKSLLASNDHEFSDEARERAQSAVEAFDNSYAARGAYANEKPLAPGEEMRILPTQGAAPTANPDAAKLEGLVRSLDPSFPLQPQVLATQPSTTHPAGDEAAKDEWVRGDLSSPDPVVVYDAPVALVRQKLLEDPQVFAAAGLSIPSDPKTAAGVQSGDVTHQAYNDYLWRQTADAAAKAGKTAYRYSKAPWMAGGANASLLSTLSTKVSSSVGPAMQGARAFLLGKDDMSSFGVTPGETSGLGRGGELPPADQQALRAKYGAEESDETRKADEAFKPLSQENDEIAEDNPVAHTAGQVVGAVPGLVTGAGKLAAKGLGAAEGAVGRGLESLAHWNAADQLWSAILGKGVPGSILGGAASAAGRGAAAGAAEQGIREVAQAGSSYADTGESGASLADSGGRVLGAAASAALPMGLGGAARGAASRVSEGISWGDRYGGAPGRLEAHGIEPKLFKGQEAPPVVREAEMRGRAEGGRSPLTVLAGDLDEPLGDAARFHVADTEMKSAEKAAEHYATPEAGYTLPVRNIVETSMQKLRDLTSEVPRKGLKGVAKPHAESPVKGILNANIESVSLRPNQYSVPMSAKEAKAFLSPQWQEKLKLDKLEKRGATVYVTPRRYDSQHADEVIGQLGKSADEDVQAIHEAAIRDREGRGGGAWAKQRSELDAAEAKATDTARRVGAEKPDGSRAAVLRAGKSEGDAADIPALRDTARRAGGQAPEQLRGALVSEDLEKIKRWEAIGGKNPRGSDRSLLGLTALGDMAVLRGVHPIASGIQKMRPGAAGKAARVTSTAAREVMDDRADERRKQRDEPSKAGYEARAKTAQADADAKKPKPKKLRFKKRRTQENRETP